jgi:hypothetical protein
MRVLYGLERLPRSLSLDDPRLPAVELGAGPLRLNTDPVPPAVLAEAGEGHAARFAAMTAWLQSFCGDYATAQRRFIVDYLAFIAAELDENRDALQAGLARYDGLYAVEDWAWSALRPLPRAWLGGARLDMAFWDGSELIGIDPANRRLPDSFRAFWAGEVLPRSPFRRPPLTQFQ